MPQPLCCGQSHELRLLRALNASCAFCGEEANDLAAHCTGCDFTLCLRCTPVYAESCGPVEEKEEEIAVAPEGEMAAPSVSEHANAFNGELPEDAFQRASSLTAVPDPVPGAIPVSESSFCTVHNCPSGHELCGGLPTTKTFCDSCTDQIHDITYSCRTCNFDACQSCVAYEARSLSCPQKHVLSSTTSTHVHGCDKCSESIPRGTSFFRCHQCNYDLCKGCVEKSGTEHPHALTATTCNAPGYGCDKCRSPIAMGSTIGECQPCQYHLCGNCFSESSSYPQSAPATFVPQAQVPPAAFVSQTQQMPQPTFVPQTQQVPQPTYVPHVPVAQPTPAPQASISQSTPMPPQSACGGQQQCKISMCTANHMLQAVPAFNRVCDVCGQDIVGMGFGCTPCGFDACMSCIDPVGMQAMQQRQVEAQVAAMQQHANAQQQQMMAMLAGMQAQTAAMDQQNMANLASMQAQTAVMGQQGMAAATGRPSLSLGNVFSRLNGSNRPSLGDLSGDGPSRLQQFTESGQSILEAYEAAGTAVELGEAAVEVGGAALDVTGSITSAILSGLGG